MKRVAALVIAGDDEGFLREWVERGSARFGAGNLYVYLEGMDRKVPDFCRGVNCHCVDFGACGVLAAGWRRRKYLLERAAELRDAGYDKVIYGKEVFCRA